MTQKSFSFVPHLILLLRLSVGIIVSVVLTAQFGLFLELPFVFYFPAPLFAVVLILSIILAVVGAFIPANQFARKSISNVLRGQE